MRKTSEEKKAEVRHLRAVERLAIHEICGRTGLSKGNVSRLLQDMPLSNEELNRRQQQRKIKPTVKSLLGEGSKYFKMVRGEPSRTQKGMIAEAAILFRLCLHGHKIFGSVFDGNTVDWMVLTSDNRTIKIQVKTASYGKYGNRTIPLLKATGRMRGRRYAEDDFDFIVGYNLFTDTAYVYSKDEVRGQKYIATMHEDHAERWDKLLV